MIEQDVRNHSVVYTFWSFIEKKTEGINVVEKHESTQPTPFQREEIFTKRYRNLIKVSQLADEYHFSRQLYTRYSPAEESGFSRPTRTLTPGFERFSGAFFASQRSKKTLKRGSKGGEAVMTSSGRCSTGIRSVFLFSKDRSK